MTDGNRFVVGAPLLGAGMRRRIDDEPDFELVIGRALSRAGALAGTEPAHLWRHVQDVAHVAPTGRGQRTRLAILANGVGLVSCVTGPDDYADAARIVQGVGVERAAELYDDVLGALDSTQDHHLSVLVRRLAHGPAITDVLRDAGCSAAEGTKIVALCTELAVNLLLTGLPEDPPYAAPPTSLQATVAELRVLHDSPGLDVLRRKLTIVAANPWGPYAAHLREAAELAELPRTGELIGAAAELLRNRQEAEEKHAVGRELRQIVAESGLSQREFASHVGTSPSRLSTYLNGQVMPSAALALRIKRVGRKLRAERAPKFAS